MNNNIKQIIGHLELCEGALNDNGEEAVHHMAVHLKLALEYSFILEAYAWQANIPYIELLRYLAIVDAVQNIEAVQDIGSLENIESTDLASILVEIKNALYWVKSIMMLEV